MDKLGKFGGVSVPGGGAVKGKAASTVSPQQKQVSFTDQKVQQQKPTQQRQAPERADTGQKEVKEQSRTPAKHGNFQVIAGKDGKVSIRLTNVSQNISFTRLSAKDLATHLAKLNLPMTEDNLKLAKDLVKFKMPLTTENLQDIKTALALMGQKTDGDAQAGIFMKLKTMGITPQNAKAMQTLFAKHPNIGQQLDQLQKLANYFSAMGRASLGDAALTALLSHVASLFGDMIAKPDKDEKKLAKKLKDMAEEVGIEDEKGISGGKGKNSARGNLSKLKQKFNDRIETLKDYVAKDQEEILKETAELLEQIDDNLEAQRLINNAPSMDDDNFIYLQLPIRTSNNQTKTVHLKLDYEYDRDGQKYVNPKKTRMEFSIQTEDMGVINIIMNVWKRRLAFSVEAENESIRQHINRNAPNFIRKLKDKAYRVTGWDCVIKKSPVTFPETLLDKEDELSELMTLDVTI